MRRLILKEKPEVKAAQIGIQLVQYEAHLVSTRPSTDDTAASCAPGGKRVDSDGGWACQAGLAQYEYRSIQGLCPCFRSWQAGPTSNQFRPHGTGQDHARHSKPEVYSDYWEGTISFGFNLIRMRTPLLHSHPVQAAIMSRPFRHF
jgi:hypothetical protein